MSLKSFSIGYILLIFLNFIYQQYCYQLYYSYMFCCFVEIKNTLVEPFFNCLLIIYKISVFHICQIKIFYLRLITIRHVILVKDAWVLLSTCRYILEYALVVLEYALDVYVHENVSNLIYTGMNFRCICS